MVHLIFFTVFYIVLSSAYCNGAAITCGPHEYLDNCPSTEFCAAEYCPKGPNQNANCFSTRPDPCPEPKCKCSFNYRRAENGTCIPTRQCPPFDCSNRINEEYNACPPLCPTDDCSQASPDGRCPPLLGNIGIILECNPTCRCKKGYWRKQGICVPYDQCPGKSAPDGGDENE